ASSIKGKLVNLVVGEDLSLKGSYINGEKVDIDVAKKIIIESVRNRNREEHSSSGFNVGVSVTWAGGVTPNIGISGDRSIK
ncbi:hypothetical protein NF27_DI00010, partial [Candidatus Jidaibacter acanthamoeba]